MLTLLHYIGDENEAIDFAHHGAASTTHNFIHTLPSYLKACEQQVK